MAAMKAPLLRTSFLAPISLLYTRHRYFQIFMARLNSGFGCISILFYRQGTKVVTHLAGESQT